jgi:hypothetical protein
MNPNTDTQSTVTDWHVVAYGALAVIGAMLGALDAGITGGTIPLPHALTPFIPVIIAGLVVMTALLPKVTDGPTKLGVKQPSADPAPVQTVPPAAPTQHVVTLQIAPTPAAPDARIVDIVPVAGGEAATGKLP